MCIVTEHKRLRREYEALQAAYANLKGLADNMAVDNAKLQLEKADLLQPKQYVPVTDLLTITRFQCLNMFKALGLTPIAEREPLDSTITLAGIAELERLAPDICYPGDWYIAETWDCDNYAAEAANDAARLFHVNGICRCFGNAPLGYHAFVCTIDKDTGELWLLEPNAGFEYSGGWVRAEEIDYKPMKVEL